MGEVGIGLIDVIGDILGGLLGAGGGGDNVTWPQFNAAFDEQGYEDLFSLQALSSIIDALKAIALFLINDVILPMLHALEAILGYLKQLVQPVLQWIVDMRKIMDQFFNTWMVPILQVISRIRQMLVLLKIFHIGWASKLDNWIAGIQARIFHNFEVVRQELNSIISWVDLVIDPHGLLRASPLAQSVGAAISEITGALTGKPVDYFYPPNTQTGYAATPGVAFAQDNSDMGAASQGTTNFWSQLTANQSDFLDTLQQAGA